MEGRMSDVDRANKWRVLGSRARRAEFQWANEQVDEVIRTVAADARFDSLLDDAAVDSWNDDARSLCDAVTAHLAVHHHPGDEPLIAYYVALIVHDWLWLPSRGAMSPFIALCGELRRRWGIRRQLMNGKTRSELFASNDRDFPRIVLRDVGNATTMVDFAGSWPHKKKYSSISAVTDTSGALYVLDVQARNEGMINPALLNDIEKLCARWRALVDEYDSHVHSMGMKIYHEGIPPFPD